MFRKLLAIVTVSLLIYSCNNQKKEESQKKYTVAFYNVENLFDTINDPNKRDDDFTPEGKLKYNSERYQHKLVNISKVLGAIDTLSLPSIIGLCEIENRTVLEDLIHQEKLKDGNYGIAHSESPDKRGIDVALLYRKDQFKYLMHKTIGIEFPWEPDYKTRDILYVQGILGTSDTLNFFINHWPSRRGGQEKSEKNRMFVAQQLRLAVNKLQEQKPNAKIIIMGDFNDEPLNKSAKETLAAGNNKNSTNPGDLYNLMYDDDTKDLGTYFYRGNWNMLDNLIVSNNLLTNSKGIHTNYNSGKIFKAKWMCYKNKEGILTPSRTYAGPHYYGGYSDHFPVFFTLTK